MAAFHAARSSVGDIESSGTSVDTIGGCPGPGADSRHMSRLISYRLFDYHPSLIASHSIVVVSYLVLPSHYARIYLFSALLCLVICVSVCLCVSLLTTV
jgi:hypothetical protein